MDGFKSSCAEVVKSNPEDRVSTMWCFILNQAFPVEQGYVLSPQYRNTRGYTDISVSQYRPNAKGILERASFLVVQTKKAGGEYGKAQWRKGEGQLQRYLGALARTGRNQHLYGVIAISRLIKFYQYNRNSGRTTLLRIRRQMYHVRDGAEKVRAALEYIKQNH